MWAGTSLPLPGSRDSAAKSLVNDFAAAAVIMSSRFAEIASKMLGELTLIRSAGSGSGVTLSTVTAAAGVRGALYRTSTDWVAALSCELKTLRAGAGLGASSDFLGRIVVGAPIGRLVENFPFPAWCNSPALKRARSVVLASGLLASDMLNP